MKTCKLCGKTKELSEFGINRAFSDNKAVYCKPCCRNKAMVKKDSVNPNRTRVRSKYSAKSSIGDGKSIIYLTKGQTAIVSECDYCLVSVHIWHLSNRGSVESRIDGKLVKMHRLITNAPSNTVVDHISGNTLDNRRENLRICTQLENSRHRTKLAKHNTSGKTGVWWSEHRKRWVASIVVCDKKHTRRFKTKEEAISCRVAMENKYFGEFVPLV